jgi:predicted dehydrogenase
MKDRRIAFVGAGAVAHCHAYALAALPFYYPDCPTIHRVAVTSASVTSRETFADRYGFQFRLSPEELWERSDIDTVYILGPNATHYTHLVKALAMPAVRRIYIEKPLCVTEAEERAITQLIPSLKDTAIQLGFQFLQMSPVRRARELWNEATFGPPIHFHARYLHSGYLDKDYRDRRRERMRPTPEGGALADLGSHALSLMSTFLGVGLEVVEAVQGGRLPDTSSDSDLCTVILCRDSARGAVGTVTASRVTAGAGEILESEIRCFNGGFRLSTESPETLEVFSASSEQSTIVNCASDFRPHSQFPGRSYPAGWLRSFIHANYLFLNDLERGSVPDLQHGLVVQRLIWQTANALCAQKEQKYAREGI